MVSYGTSFRDRKVSIKYLDVWMLISYLVGICVGLLIAGCSISVGPYEARLLQDTRLTLSTNHADPNGPP